MAGQQADTAKINIALTLCRNDLGSDVVDHIRGLVTSGSDSVKKLYELVSQTENFKAECRAIYKATTTPVKKGRPANLNTQQVERGPNPQEKEENEELKKKRDAKIKRSTHPPSIEGTEQKREEKEK